MARASLEELHLDYQDFLRHRNQSLWPATDPRRSGLIARRCRTAQEEAEWIEEEHGRDGRSGRRETYAGIAANAALVLIAVACSLLDRQIASLAAAFENEGGFTEKLYRIRSQRRGCPPRP